MNEELKVGDVVSLIDDEQKMTVTATKVECTWFDKENKLHQEIFSKEELTKIS